MKSSSQLHSVGGATVGVGVRLGPGVGETVAVGVAVTVGVFVTVGGAGVSVGVRVGVSVCVGVGWPNAAAFRMTGKVMRDVGVAVGVGVGPQAGRAITLSAINGSRPLPKVALPSTVRVTGTLTTPALSRQVVDWA